MAGMVQCCKKQQAGRIPLLQGELFVLPIFAGQPLGDTIMTHFCSNVKHFSGGGVVVVIVGDRQPEETVR